MLQLPGFLIYLYEKTKKLFSRWISVHDNNDVDKGPITNSNALIEDYAYGPQRITLHDNAYLKLDNQPKMTVIQNQIDDLKAVFNQRINEVERSFKSIESENRQISVPSGSSSGNMIDMQKVSFVVGKKQVRMNINK